MHILGGKTEAQAQILHKGCDRNGIIEERLGGFILVAPLCLRCASIRAN